MAFLLTASGIAKIKAVREKVQAAMILTLARETIEARQVAAELAPSPDEEAALLSRGVAQGGPGGGQAVGTPEGNRFIRDGSMVSVREAIATDPIEQSDARFAAVIFGTGSPRRINERTGFSWGTRRRGVQGPTMPFNRAYLQALENGGAFWLVTPRTRALLEPEPGILTTEMIKTLPPFGMFRQAAAARRGPAREAMETAVRDAARSVR